MSNINKLAVYFKKELSGKFNHKDNTYRCIYISFKNYEKDDAEKLREVMLTELNSTLDILDTPDTHSYSRYSSSTLIFRISVCTDDIIKFNKYWATFKSYWKIARKQTRGVKNCSCNNCTVACECDCHTEYRRLWLLNNPFYSTEKSKERLESEKNFPNIMIAGRELSHDLDNQIKKVCINREKYSESVLSRLSEVMDIHDSQNINYTWFDYVYENDILQLSDTRFFEEYNKYKTRLDKIEKFRNDFIQALDTGRCKTDFSKTIETGVKVIKTYKYTYKSRGYSPMCQPREGLEHVTSSKNHKFEILEYSRELTNEEINEYELIRIS